MHAKWVPVVVVLFLVALSGGLALAEEATPSGVEPIGIEPTPAQPGGLWIKIELLTGKSAYAVGEEIRLSFEINQPAYVYIFDVPPDQQVLNIFPNEYTSLSNPLAPGRYVLPGNDSYSLTVTDTGGLGQEYFGAIASTKPLDLLKAGEYVLGALLGKDSASFQSNLSAVIQGVQPKPDQNALKEFNIAVIPIKTYKKASSVPKQGRLLIKSTPPALLLIDGRNYGYTLKDEFRQIPLDVGIHQLSLARDGCQPYTSTINLKDGDNRFFDIDLNYLPLPYFYVRPVHPHAGETIRFNAYESEDRDGTIEKYEWDFDSDGQIDAAGHRVEHVFAEQGTYMVTLIVTDDKGAKNQLSKSIKIWR